jgi:flagellin-like hook-associated protein FlgL
LIQQSLMVNLGPFWRNPVAINSALDRVLTGGSLEIGDWMDILSGELARKKARIQRELHAAKEAFQPVLGETTRSGTKLAAAAGAATWETVKTATAQASAQVAQTLNRVSNPQLRKAAFARFDQRVEKLQARVWSRFVRKKDGPAEPISEWARDVKAVVRLVTTPHWNRRMGSIRERIQGIKASIRVSNLLHRNKLPAEAQRSRVGKSRSKTRNGRGERMSPFQTAKNNAHTIWDRHVGKKPPVSKALGAPLSETHPAKSVHRASEKTKSGDGPSRRKEDAGTTGKLSKEQRNPRVEAKKARPAERRRNAA